MTWITTLDDLHSHYGTPSAPAVVKVTPHLTPSYRAFLDRSRFCVLTTVGPEGTDGSPRGDQGPVVSVLDPKTLALPDWKGNERIDSLRNIVRDGRVSLMFLVPGSTNALRINGTAKLTDRPRPAATASPGTTNTPAPSSSSRSPRFTPNAPAPFSALTCGPPATCQTASPLSAPCCKRPPTAPSTPRNTTPTAPHAPIWAGGRLVADQVGVSR